MSHRCPECGCTVHGGDFIDRADFTRRAAAGLLLDLRPHTFGELSAVDRSGKVISMQEELDTLTAIRRHVRTA